MSKSRTASRSAAVPLLSLPDAAALAGVPRRVLRGRIHQGDIPVRLLGKGKRPKVRLTPAALAAAGLLGDDVTVRGVEGQATPSDPNLALLLEMIRDQNRRIAALEDQRFQLAAELGATVERSRSLETRLSELPIQTQSTDAGFHPVTSEPPSSPVDENEPPAPPPDSWTQPNRIAPLAAAPEPRQTATSRQSHPTQPPVSPPPVPPLPSRAWRAGALVRRGAVRLLINVGPASSRNDLA